MSTVVVGMSGGVDSSVSALLLKQQGYKVIGLFMKNWEESSGDCNATADYEDVLRVCAQLEIPCYPVNFVKEYWDRVFSQFLEELRLGYTPNPDILCNREIKFNLFLEKALEVGADYLATGHYCQIGPDFTLLKGLDPEKDQSYFLYTLSQNILKKILFPVGGLLKSEVRRLAHEHNLVTAAKKDSTGICFIGKRDMKTFLKPYLGYQPGPFKTLDGTVIGEHVGMAYYTLGQRKGLGIGGPGEAWFVIGKDLKRNVVRLAQGADHPSLYVSSLIATDLTWVSHPAACRCTAKIRYRQQDQPCSVEFLTATTARVTFDTPQRAPAARQSIVFYQGSICLGGGLISPDTLPFYN